MLIPTFPFLHNPDTSDSILPVDSITPHEFPVQQSCHDLIHKSCHNF